MQSKNKRPYENIYYNKIKYNSDNITDRNVGMELCAYTSRPCEYLLELLGNSFIKATCYFVPIKVTTVHF